ncbi:MAG: four helix bundle protein [Patescibacteria group bacterium]|nr:four helix bundle protein [Patescibacteria group bacterium]
MFRFQSLNVWVKSHSFVKEVFKLCDDIPSKYRFTLVQQLVRAGLSITNNISEGSGRSSTKDQNYYYTIARGSTLEAVNMIILVKEIGLVGDEAVNRLLYKGEEILKMLYVLRKNN